MCRDACTTLFDGRKENTTVTKLSIVENKLGQKACRHLFHALKENLNVVTLVSRRLYNSYNTAALTIF